MHPFPLADYFNAGVLLLDCRSIINNEALAKKMKDLKNASKYYWLDQTHLNNLFKGHVTYLDEKYNCFWGDYNYQYFKRFKNKQNFSYKDAPVILHYTGPYKPWNIPNMSKFEILKRKLLGKKYKPFKYQILLYKNEILLYKDRAKRYMDMLQKERDSA